MQLPVLLALKARQLDLGLESAQMRKTVGGAHVCPTPATSRAGHDQMRCSPKLANLNPSATWDDSVQIGECTDAKDRRPRTRVSNSCNVPSGARSDEMLTEAGQSQSERYLG